MWPFTSYNKTEIDSVTNIAKFIRKICPKMRFIRNKTYSRARKNLPVIPAGFEGLELNSQACSCL